MANIFAYIKDNPLWDGVTREDFEKMSRCMDSKVRVYEKGEIVLLAGEAADRIGMLIRGGALIVRTDAEGNSTILAELTPPDTFGETLACAGVGVSPFTVQAAEKSEILFMDYKKVITTCPSACVFHSKLIENMLKVIAQKNLMLNQKIDILSRRSTRDKLMAFFDAQRGAAKKFTIPFNREELADYIRADRSAMSKELCKMRDEGLIKFNKNQFELL